MKRKAKSEAMTPAERKAPAGVRCDDPFLAHGPDVPAAVLQPIDERLASPERDAEMNTAKLCRACANGARAWEASGGFRPGALHVSGMARFREARAKTQTPKCKIFTIRDGGAGQNSEANRSETEPVHRKHTHRNFDPPVSPTRPKTKSTS